MDLVKVPLDTSFDSWQRVGAFTSRYLPPETYVLKWTFRKNWVHDEDNPIALALVSFWVEGDVKGGAQQCATCLPGYSCLQGTNSMSACQPGFYSDKPNVSVCERCTGNSVTTDLAEYYCRQCPNGTKASNNNDRCENTCHYVEGEFEYDLRSLKGRRFGPILPTNVKEGDRNYNDYLSLHRYYFSLCEPVNKDGDDTCNIHEGKRVELAYVCQRLNANRSYSLGDWVRYKSLGYTGLELQFTSGDRCSNGAERTTNITLLCVDQKSTNRQVSFVAENPMCHYTFTLYDPSACPACTAASYNRTYSDCDKDGMQIETWYVKPEAIGCQGGMGLPAPRSVHCNRCLPNYYDSTWSDCNSGSQQTVYFVKKEYQGCVDDGSNTPTVATRSCSVIDAKPGANTFTIVVLSVFTSVVVLALCLWRVTKERNKLSVQYQLLARESANSSEMVPSAATQEEDDEFNQPSAESSA